MSDSKKYLSKYSNGKTVSAAQYITEMICEKKAKMDKKDLHYRFWVNPIWERFYRDQIASAHKLLKKYPEKAIIKALSSAKAEKIYSLRAPHLGAIIEHENELLKKEDTSINMKLERPSSVSFGQQINKKNIISKLKGLDDDS